MDFHKILNSCWWKFNLKKTHFEIFELEKRVDVDQIIKSHFAEDILKKILNKVEIIKEDMWMNGNFGPSPNINNLTNQLTIDYKTEMIILNKKELFDLLYSFKNLPEKEKESFLKKISPSEEYYINEVRNERLEKIFDEMYNSPFQNNI